MAQYIANPVIVTAFVIQAVTPIPSGGGAHLDFGYGVETTATAAMLSRYTPEAGDYFVEQEDGYEYVCQKAVFERKYTPTLKAVAPIETATGSPKIVEFPTTATIVDDATVTTPAILPAAGTPVNGPVDQVPGGPIPVEIPAAEPEAAPIPQE